MSTSEWLLATGISIRLHDFTNTVSHKPSGFEGNTKGAVQLIAGDAFLAASDQINGL